MFIKGAGHLHKGKYNMSVNPSSDASLPVLISDHMICCIQCYIIYTLSV